ncbi:hypothetical protein RA20_14660 [Leisingera sp. ANG-Vp]|nr:hypothetical protein RA20_14660 [Leisingera sp. ANG-Vp]
MRKKFKDRPIYFWISCVLLVFLTWLMWEKDVGLSGKDVSILSVLVFFGAMDFARIFVFNSKKRD